jgi:hypothetical protein
MPGKLNHSSDRRGDWPVLIEDAADLGPDRRAARIATAARMTCSRKLGVAVTARTPGPRLRLQQAHDLWGLKREMADELARIPMPRRAA